MKLKLIHTIDSKSKNRRVNVSLYKDPNGFNVFRVSTKRLVDFKTRNIVETDNFYTINTFMIMSDLMNLLMSSPEIRKQIPTDELESSGVLSVKTTVKSLCKFFKN